MRLDRKFWVKGFEPRLAGWKKIQKPLCHPPKEILFNSGQESNVEPMEVDPPSQPVISPFTFFPSWAVAFEDSWRVDQLTHRRNVAAQRKQ